MLCVKFDADFGHEIELGFEEVDMVFLHRKHFLLFSCQDIGPALHFGTSKIDLRGALNRLCNCHGPTRHIGVKPLHHAAVD